MNRIHDLCEIFNDILKAHGEEPLSESLLQTDFGITDNCTEEEVNEWANDYLSECDSERVESKAIRNHHDEAEEQDAYNREAGV